MEWAESVTLPTVNQVSCSAPSTVQIDTIATMTVFFHTASTWIDGIIACFARWRVPNQPMPRRFRTNSGVTRSLCGACSLRQTSPGRCVLCWILLVQPKYGALFATASWTLGNTGRLTHRSHRQSIPRFNSAIAGSWPTKGRQTDEHLQTVPDRPRSRRRHCQVTRAVVGTARSGAMVVPPSGSVLTIAYTCLPRNEWHMV